MKTKVPFKNCGIEKTNKQKELGESLYGIYIV